MPLKIFLKKYWKILTILIAVLLAYGPVLGHGFLYWDDYFQIITNYQVKNFSLSNALSLFVPRQNPLGMYQPLASLTFSLEYKLFGQSALAFHAGNLLWHLICVATVYIFLSKLTKDKTVAFVATLWFAINPVNGEAINWLSARSTLLFTCFGLWSMICYLNYSQKATRKYFYLTYLFFCLALLAKATAIVIPLLLLLIDWLSAKKLTRESILEKLPAFLLSIGFGLLAIVIRHDSHLAVVGTQIYNWFDKTVLLFYSLGNHLFKVFIPLNLANFYDYPAKLNNHFGWEIYLLALLGVGLIGSLIYKMIKRQDRLEIFLLLFFVINLLPMIKVVESSTPIIADRYVYLAQLGPLTLAIIYFKKINWLKKLFKLFIILSLAISLIGINLLLGQTWKNDITVLERTIKINPTCAKAYGLLGDTYIKLAKLDLAEEAYLSAVKYNPDDKTLWNNLGLIYERLQQWPEALVVLNKASAGEQTNPIVFRLKGLALANLNQTTEAIKNFNLAIVLEPDNGENYFYRGLSLANVGKNQAACQSLLKAIDLGYNVNKELKEKICQ